MKLITFIKYPFHIMNYPHPLLLRPSSQTSSPILGQQTYINPFFLSSLFLLFLNDTQETQYKDQLKFCSNQLIRHFDL